MIKDYNIRISSNFYLCELMPPEMFVSWAINPRWYLTEFLARVPQKLRDHFNKPVTINNWYNGGSLNERGFRMPDTKTGARLSQHKIGNAIDINISGLESAEIIAEIAKSHKKFPEIRAYERIEDTPGWLHLDGRNTGQSRLLEVPGK